jgi:hypothetical protein
VSLGRVVSIAVPVRKRNEIRCCFRREDLNNMTEFCHEMSIVSSVNVCQVCSHAVSCTRKLLCTVCRSCVVEEKCTNLTLLNTMFSDKNNLLLIQISTTQELL